jgi:radical SAM superfamily enzyme YgiQ (UPF0313 family)
MIDKFDCCLISLPKPFLKQPEAQASLGLLYLAASLREQNRSVSIENYATLSEDEAISVLPSAKIFGITTTSLEILQANSFSKKIKEKYPDAKVIIGGPGSYSKEFIDFSTIDAICYGDGEYAIHTILQDAENNALHKEYIGGMVRDLDTLPLPARDLLRDNQGGNIFAYGKKYAEGKSTIILSSRGCVHQCSFCSAPKLTHSRKLRFRSPEKVAEEIRHVKKTYGIKQFRFSDDMFTASEKRTLDLCAAIEKEEVFWRISCRVKPLTRRMLQAMYKAGCRELSFGIESFDDNVLKTLNKKATALDNMAALSMAHYYGFSTRILMMIRTPGQTPETIIKNIECLKKIPYSIVACTAFIPIPGSDVWDNPDKYNIEILDKDLNKYNFYMYNDNGRRKIDPIINIKGRDVDEFHEESEFFRDWLEDTGKVNKG